MSRPLLILKTGSTVSPLLARRGDFEDWFRAGMGLDDAAAPLLDARSSKRFPEGSELCGVVVTGSPAMVTERAAWSVRAAAWLAARAREETPLLGICYGHQLLAGALGGTVGWSPNGREIGTVTVELCAAAADDPLLRGMPSPLPVQTSHSQSVLELPPGARRLAGNEHDPNQAFAWGRRAWGFQFHPEFDADIVRGYLLDRRADLLAEGLHPEALSAAAADHDHGSLMLRRFAAICLGNRS